MRFHFPCRTWREHRAELGLARTNREWRRWAPAKHPRFVCRLLIVIALGSHASGLAAQERTIDEIKAETQVRAERGAYPLIGLDPTDVREALANIKTRDRDEWAAAWSAVADRYAQAAARSTSVAERRSNYLRAWRLYYFAQWPVAASEGKKAAYIKALDSYVRSSDSLAPSLEVVRIPFEGKEIVGYLRLPRATTGGPVPVVIAVSGLDSRK